MGLLDSTGHLQDLGFFPFIVLAALGNGMPSLLGVLLTALFSGKSGLGELFRRLGRVRVPLIWYAVVLLLLPVLQLVALGVPTLLGLATITLPGQASLSSAASVRACLKSSAGEDSPCHDCKRAVRHSLPACCSASCGVSGISH
jgi:hypothetical protein